ncbi:hypothetical protein CDL12_23117 [Handroanthus impetiginosus]|uniref:Uncharacterized protein n=1 Tax=Handroanthus impetiginosus TaxID=429701 RepID=A0A2G9GGM1_9LAMI|nr:hypothetical protein CDL12_23117 [Handroanthus impetiginosus]
MPATPQSLLCVSLLLLSSSLSHSFSFSNYQALFSLSHSLTSRVATLRAARGDLEGAARARKLAHNIERGLGLGFYKFAWNVGWDYVKNYGSGDAVSFETLGGVLSDVNELLGALGELNQIQSDAERVAWVGRNYKDALRVSKSLFGRLLKVFHHSGPLREVVVILQQEILEGDLLRDCLELGADDLKGLLQVLKDIALQYASAPPKTEL